MRMLLIVVLLVFSISSFGQRKKIEEKYEFKNGKNTGRVLGLNFYGDTVNRIPVKFLSLKDLQAFREYEFDTIPEWSQWRRAYIVYLRMNQKSKKIPYIRAQREIPDNSEDQGVAIATHASVFGSCALVYTEMNLGGYEYSKRIASNVKMFDAFGKMIYEVTDTTESIFEYVEIDEDAKFVACVTYTGPNEYGIIKGGTKESSSTVSIYSLPDIKLVWRWFKKDISNLGVNYYRGFFYWVIQLMENENEIVFFDSKNNSAYQLIFNPETLNYDFSENENGFLKNFDGFLFKQKDNGKRIAKYFDRDFEKLK